MTVTAQALRPIGAIAGGAIAGLRGAGLRLDPVTRATIVGSFAVLLWALWPSLAMLASAVPPFLLLAIAFASAFGVFAAVRVVRREPVAGCLVAPGSVLGFGLIGVCAANIFYILALRSVPPAEANIISYTWPIMIVTITALLGWVVPRKRHVVAIAMGFAGAVVIIGPTTVLQGTWFGYLLAVLSALSWSVFSVSRLRFTGGPRDVVGGVCGWSVPICVVAHLALERTYALTFTEFAAMVAIGVGPVGGAISLWDYGVRNGRSKHLAIFAYATPFLATVLLVALGFAQVTWALVAGGVLITASAALGNSDLNKIPPNSRES